MKIGNIEVEQKIGTVRSSDLLVEMPAIAYRGWDGFHMRGGYDLYRESLIEVGVQHKVNIKDIISLNTKFKVEPEIRLSFNDYDFFKLTLVAAFLPRRDLKFVRGMLRIALRDEGDGQPSIYSIAPLKINDNIKRTKKFGIAPDLSLLDIELNPGVEYVSETAFEEVHPQIIGNYSAESWAMWDYRTTDVTREIVGTQVMELVVKQSIGSVSKAQVELEGRVKWRNLSASFKGFLKGDLQPELPSPDFVTFTIG